VDAAAKTLGEGLFADDVVLPGMLYARRCARNTRARIL
jgi:CO/xanthine dehydrogenase Mo-binding subunit